MITTKTPKRTAEDMAQDMADDLADAMIGFPGFSKQKLVEDLLPKAREMLVIERYLKVLYVLFPNKCFKMLD